MSDLDRTAVLETSLERQLAWIARADGKTNFVFGAATALLGTEVAMVSSADLSSCFSVFVFSTAILLQFASLLILFLAMFPRLSGPPSSMIYFGGIVKHGEDEFKEMSADLNVGAYQDDLQSQVYRNAEIADAKFRLVALSMKALFASIPCWLLTIYLIKGA